MGLSKLFLLLVLLVVIGCNEDNNNDDQQGEVLDHEIVGSWEVIRYEDLDGSNQTFSPDNENPVVINFSDSLRFSGNTNNNEFEGDFTVNDTSIFITGFVTTAVSETDWGMMFYDALRDAQSGSDISSFTWDYTLTPTTLVIQSNDQMRMILMAR